jgi:thioredoxin reductase (NADPH)
MPPDQGDPRDLAETMPLPVVLAVDGSRDSLEAVESQLTQRYAHDYRVMCLGDAGVAVRKLAELARAGEEVALVLAGMPPSATVPGELLERARGLYPHAKRALLVALNVWADKPSADAIRAAIAFGAVDYYVVRPAGTPDEVFHEAVSSFLLEWATERRTVPHTVHIVGEAWSGRAYELRNTFERCAAPHSFCLADSDQGRELLAVAGPHAKLPVMILPGGRVLSDPSNAEIAAAAGAPGDVDQRSYDVVIVGAGPAGLSAAVYGGAEGLSVLVVDEGGIGGQARSSSLIRNYLGFPKGVSGSRLAEQAYEQASVFGASFVFMHRATALTRSGHLLEVALDGGQRVTARAVILATGAAYRRLGVPALEALNGAGVYYGGPVTEAPVVSGREAYVVGGGNSAGQAALHLARYARQVALVVRAQSLGAGMSNYLVRGIEAAPNIEVRTGSAVVGGGGDGRLQHLMLRQGSTGRQDKVAADALFVLIGAHPRTDWLPSEIARNARGFLLTGEEFRDGCDWPVERRPYSLETSMPAVIAAGDVRHSSVKRVASAVGEGSIAIQIAQTLLGSEQPGAARPPGERAAAHLTTRARA